MSPGFLGLAVATVLALTPLTLRAWRRAWARRRWRALGPILELSPFPSSTRVLLAGRYRGHPVEVSLLRTGASRLRLTLGVKLPQDFALLPQGWGLRWRGASKERDIQVGQPALDAAFLIRGANPAAVIRLLGEPVVRDALRQLQARGAPFQLQGQELIASPRGSLSEESIRELLRDLAGVASALQSTAENHRALAASAREAVQDSSPATGTVLTVSARRDLDSQRFVRIREEFSRRLALHNTVVFAGGVVGLLGGGLWLFLRRAPPPDGWDLAGVPFAAGFICASLTSMVSRYFHLLCPGCGNNLQDFDNTDSDGSPTLSLDRCPHCDVWLR
ncbi:MULTISPECIES: zf-TFIIB domain-containing protein [Corallococcus]|uniref:TFIIB-type zinc ribbon-containing protein n=1 Tax=Corallococcus TaxID=83461 RepID=UPI0011C35509|nr:MULTISPECIES: zf-TFIIB domain-containing protein [Corallococcus]NPC45572.1 zf-TFIIB domain-containing protein [Corallococcus exiguus]